MGLARATEGFDAVIARHGRMLVGAERNKAAGYGAEGVTAVASSTTSVTLNRRTQRGD